MVVGPTRLAECFIVAGTGERLREDRELSRSREGIGCALLEAAELLRVPKSPKKGELPELTRFLFPNGLAAVTPPSPSLLPLHGNPADGAAVPPRRTFWFVLTQMDGARFYCTCLWFFLPASRQQQADLRRITYAAHVEGPASGVASAAATRSSSASSSTTVKGMAYLPVAFCLVSRHPNTFSLFGQCLEELHVLWRARSPLFVPTVAHLLEGVRLPLLEQRVRFSLVSCGPCFQLDCSPGDDSRVRLLCPAGTVRLLFDIFGVAGALQLFAALVHEHNVLFVSSQYALLSAAAEALSSLLFPFAWHHVYIPILPATMLGVLSSPAPFLIGTHSDLLSRELHHHQFDALIAHLDRGSIACSSSSSVAASTSLSSPPTSPLLTSLDRLPVEPVARLYQNLNPILRPNLNAMDFAYISQQPPSPERSDALIRATFALFWAELFLHTPRRDLMLQGLKSHPARLDKWQRSLNGDYRDCLRRLRRFPRSLVVIDKVTFLQHHPHRDFLAPFFLTQAFSVFLEKLNPEFDSILDALKPPLAPAQALSHIVSLFLPPQPGLTVDFSRGSPSFESCSSSLLDDSVVSFKSFPHVDLPELSPSFAHIDTLDNNLSNHLDSKVEENNSNCSSTWLTPFLSWFNFPSDEDREDAGLEGPWDPLDSRLTLLKLCLEQVFKLGRVDVSLVELHECFSTDFGRMTFSQLLLNRGSDASESTCGTKASFNLLVTLLKEVAMAAHRACDFDSLQKLFEVLHIFSWADPKKEAPIFLKDTVIIPEIWHDLQFWEVTFITGVSIRRYVLPILLDDQPISLMDWAMISEPDRERILLKEDELIHDVLQTYAFNMVHIGVDPHIIGSFLHRMSDLTNLRFEWTQDLMVLVNNIARAQSENAIPSLGVEMKSPALLQVVENTPPHPSSPGRKPVDFSISVPPCRRNSLDSSDPRRSQRSRRDTHTRRASDVLSVDLELSEPISIPDQPEHVDQTTPALVIASSSSQSPAVGNPASLLAHSPVDKPLSRLIVPRSSSFSLIPGNSSSSHPHSSPPSETGPPDAPGGAAWPQSSWTEVVLDDQDAEGSPSTRAGPPSGPLMYKSSSHLTQKPAIAQTSAPELPTGTNSSSSGKSKKKSGKSIWGWGSTKEKKTKP